MSTTAVDRMHRNMCVLTVVILAFLIHQATPEGFYGSGESWRESTRDSTDSENSTPRIIHSKNDLKHRRHTVMEVLPPGSRSRMSPLGDPSVVVSMPDQGKQRNRTPRGRGGSKTGKWQNRRRHGFAKGEAGSGMDEDIQSEETLDNLDLEYADGKQLGKLVKTLQAQYKESKTSQARTR